MPREPRSLRRSEHKHTTTAAPPSTTETGAVLEITSDGTAKTRNEEPTMTTDNTTQPPNAQPPVHPATPDNKPDDKEPAWLPDRLDRARKEGAKAAKEEARKAILA